ncbi:MAG TPA: ATP-binding protein, partial [bacterium]|nr:ATP-binding protein [bacterium]
IGRLAAGIAHEVNNPLTAVLTFAHLLRESPKADDDQKQDLDVIVRETTRVREIVRGLLDFARESPSRRQILDINEILQRTLSLLKSQKDFGKIKIDLCLQDSLPPVMGDRNQMQQVFLNLSLNACEAMPEGGVLTVTTRQEESTVRVYFADTGCGISQEFLTQIFDPFFTTKPVGKGTGLGLSVSYGIIQQHGGQLLVNSTPNEGSTFTVVLQVCTDPVYLIEDEPEADRGAATPQQG